MKRIHKVKTDVIVKDTIPDEKIEILRDNCNNLRDRAMIDFLLSTGIRVGELVRLNIDDIDFSERECVVYGKGDKERKAYFDAKTKIHLLNYIESRTDNNIALFVSLNKPHSRLTESGVELRLREMGKKLGVEKVHPHKFRRTMATAIDMYLKQISLVGGIPFSIVLPKAANSVNADMMSVTQIHQKLEKGYADIEKGNVEDAASAFVAFRERH